MLPLFLLPTPPTCPPARAPGPQELEARLKSGLQEAAAGAPGMLRALIDTILGNLQLRITNVHVRYEDTASNPGHEFAVRPAAPLTALAAAATAAAAAAGRCCCCHRRRRYLGCLCLRKPA
jgi:hypothetical protein